MKKNINVSAASYKNKHTDHTYIVVSKTILLLEIVINN